MQRSPTGSICPSEQVPLGVEQIRLPIEKSNGQIRCCVDGCREWLLPRRRSSPGTACPEHHITLGWSRPTYVYDEAHVQQNFIVATELIHNVAAGKRESHRLGHENSEDAVSWNVFVSLMQLGGLKDAFEVLSGRTAGSDIELYMWGSRIDESGSSARWSALSDVHSQIELKDWLQTHSGRRPGCTELDIVLRDPGRTLLVIEAKLSSRNSYLWPDRIEEYLHRYRVLPGRIDPLNRSWIRSQTGKVVLGQLLRNAVFAGYLAEQNETPVVVNLARQDHEQDICSRMRLHLKDGILFFRRCWEDIYNLPVVRSESAATLRAYLEGKTVYLSKAFHTS